MSLPSDWDNLAATYEAPAASWTRLYAPDLLRLAPGRRLLDVACGTGAVALVAAAHGREVTGADFSPGMLDVARQEAREKGLSVTLHQCDAQDLPFPDAAFDAVTCHFSLIYMPDRERALRQMARVLAPGGDLVCTVWAPAAESGRDLIFMEPFFARFPAEMEVYRLAMSLSPAGAIEALFQRAGLAPVTVHRLRVERPLTIDWDHWWQAFTASPAPWAQATAALPTAEQAALRRAVEAAAAPYRRADGRYHVNATCLAAHWRKA